MRFALLVGLLAALALGGCSVALPGVVAGSNALARPRTASPDVLRGVPAGTSATVWFHDGRTLTGTVQRSGDGRVRLRAERGDTLVALPDVAGVRVARARYPLRPALLFGLVVDAVTVFVVSRTTLPGGPLF